MLLFIFLLCFCVIVGALQGARPSTGRCCCLYCCCVVVLMLVPCKMLAHPKVGVIVDIVVVICISVIIIVLYCIVSSCVIFSRKHRVSLQSLHRNMKFTHM